MLTAALITGCSQYNPILFEAPDDFSDTIAVFQHNWENLAKNAIDASHMLEKPAGVDGFITIRDGHFFTPGGSQFRVWGVNLTGGACYPEPEDAGKVADLLASLGINAVRFHFMDSRWGADATIFRTDTNTTRTLNPVQLDKLDYFVSELSKRGIYSNFNLNVGRTFREGDDVPFYNYLGIAKAVTLFDDRIIALQKEYAMQLLSHENPYTGNEYRNEPSLAFVEIVNENSLTEAWVRRHLEGTHESTRTSTWIDIPPYYAKKLTRKYNQWLLDTLGPEGLADLKRSLRIPAGAEVPRLKNDQFISADSNRFHLEAAFIMETEDAFYSGMYRFLKDTVKVNQLVAANSDHNHWRSGYALLSATSKLDFVDGHVYWQHPNYFRNEETGEQGFRIDNTPMVNDPWFSTVAQLSRSAVQGMPYTISEINHPYPNEYACEMVPVLASYALLHDWDGIYFYTFEHSDPSEWNTKRPGHFDIMHDPVKMANIAAAGYMFHRGDIQAASHTVIRNYNWDALVAGIRGGEGERPFFTPGLDPVTPLVQKTRIGSFQGGDNDFPKVHSGGPIRSETGELTWKYEEGKGLVCINTSKSQGFSGFTETMARESTENLEVRISNVFASVLLTSLDGMDITGSKKMLLTATATSILSGAKWNEERTSLISWGESPFMIQPVGGAIKLKSLKGRGEMVLMPLNPDGYPIESKQQAFKIHQGEVVFEIGAPVAVSYIIERR